ncbi:hypothetical protein CK203_002292 [Vitis vinifera]|uniref:Uncharacterized protein n=1 Tax=Vitis vinifera TaxID=29760 RepID=A0A438KIX2_VITVI|nr:hypothetical protein CK203_002292 [Vitis vinifera]
MAPPAAPAAVEGSGEGGGGAQRQQQEPGYRQTIAGIIRIAVFWYFASKLFSPRKPTPSDPAIQISNLFQKAEPLVLFSLYHLFFFPMCSNYHEIRNPVRQNSRFSDLFFTR